MQPHDELTRTRELLAEIQQERDRLADQVGQNAIERADLLRLLENAQQQLGVAQQQLQELLLARPEPHEPLRTTMEDELVLIENVQGLPRWWTIVRDGKQSLGASLTVTGFVELAVGIVLHFALRANIVETEAHLGYIIGLVGLLSLLIGLVLVF